MFHGDMTKMCDRMPQKKILQIERLKRQWYTYTLRFIDFVWALIAKAYSEENHSKMDINEL